MLLCFDIGNTCVTAAVFNGEKIVKRFRFVTRLSSPSRHRREGSSYQEIRKIIVKNLGKKYLNSIDGVCISNVVAGLNGYFKDSCLKLFGKRPLFVSSANSKVKITGYNSKQLGADRLVNALAAYRKYKRALIVVDAGSGITIDVINSKGEFDGGVIAAGMKLSADALNKMSIKLPKIRIGKPKHITGTSTESAMKSGIYFGTVGMIDYLVQKIASEKKIRNPLVIATGGHAKLIAAHSKTIRYVDPDLTLKGIKIVWDENARHPRES